MRLKFLAAAALIITISATSAYAVNLIGEDKAIQIAETAARGLLLKADLKMEGQKLVYSVSILDDKNNINILLVNAVTGVVEKTMKEKTDSNKAKILRTAKLSHKKAIKIAAKDEMSATIKEWELDKENNKAVYAVEFIDTSGFYHDIYVDAISGEVVKADVEREMIPSSMTKTEAEKAALNLVNGNILYTMLDEEDGILYYQVTIISEDAKMIDVIVNTQTKEAHIKTDD